jgi:acetyl esterase
MDEEIASFVAAAPHLDLRDVEGARRTARSIYEQSQGQGEPSWLAQVDVVDRTVPGPPGAEEVPVRIFRPHGVPGPLPALVYFHGGAFVLGDLEANARVSGRYAPAAGVLVVHVDYRLAPEHPYPAGMEDCYAVLEWVFGQAEELGVDPDRVAVGGSSAGGCLAAACALRARDDGGPPIAFQMLIYPALDDRQRSSSVRTFVDTPMWDGPNNSLMWGLYLGPDGPGGDHVSQYAAPARAVTLAGLPPAFVLTCEFDPLRDEGNEFALRMLGDGVEVDLHVVPGTCHGFDVLPTEVSRRAFEEEVQALRRALGQGRQA